MEEEKPKKPGPGKSEFAKLIEVMESNNKSTDKIQIDGRNTRRHLLEMKNMQKVMNDFQARTVFGFENFQDMIDNQSLQGMEDSRERMSIFEEIRDELRQLPKETAAATKDKDGGGGMIGGKIAGVLAGVGAAALGVGVGIAAVMSQVPKLVEAFENADMEKIKKNIMVLTSIEDELGGKANMMAEGGALAIFLTGVGIGLAAFGAGAAVAAAVTKFESDGWPEKIVHNVKTLLGIAELNTGDTGAVFKALTGIGFGLTAFGIGSFFSQAASEEKAKEVKEAVATYLSIAELDNATEENADLVSDTLKALGKGLRKFGVGSFFANAASNETAIEVRDSVESLLQINDIPGANPEQGEKVSKTLSSLKKGLVDFGVGSFFAKAVGSGMGANVRKQVKDLLTIGEEIDPKHTEITVAALNNLGDGLNKFAQGSFATSISDFYGGIMDFFSGSEGPVEQAIRVGKEADKINKGANAFNAFVDSVDALSKLGRINLGLEDEIESLVNYTRTFDKIIDGGKIKIGTNFKTEGLAELQKDMDAHVSSIVRLRDALQMQTPGGATMSSPNPIDGMMVNTLSVENAILKIPDNSSGSTNVAAVSAPQNMRGGDNILIQNNTGTVTDSLAVER